MAFRWCLNFYIISWNEEPIGKGGLSPLIDAVVPIRLINGIEDPVSGKHAAERFREAVPNANIILLANSGHYPHVETPKEVIKALFEFHGNLD